MGRLVDEQGAGLTPSHARKGVKKYRYYVSRNCPARGELEARRGWRLPARELEARVAAAIGEMLGDESALLEATAQTEPDSGRIEQVLQAARSWRQRFASEAERSAALAATGGTGGAPS